MRRHLARTGSEFSDFGPYVASIDDDGRVAFFAELVSGEHAVVVVGELLAIILTLMAWCLLKAFREEMPPLTHGAARRHYNGGDE